MHIEIVSNTDYSYETRVEINRTFDNLSDATDFVNRVQKVKDGMPAPMVEVREVKTYPNVLGDDRTRAVRRAFGLSGERVHGVVTIRALTGCGLKEAKDFFEYLTHYGD